MNVAKGKLLVIGGTGLVGLNVARRAVERGWQVTALSRKQYPLVDWTQSSLNKETQIDTSWQSKVTWVGGNALDPDLAHRLTTDTDVVVHALGILFQTPEYNQVVNGATVTDTLAAIPSAAHTLMQQLRGTYDSKRLLNFDAIQAISAQNYLTNISEGKSFLYVSAAVTPLMTHFVNPNYVRTKQKIESELLQQTRIRPVIFRPGLIKSSHRPLTRMLGLGSDIGASLGLVPKRIDVSDLAEAILVAAETPKIQGVLEYNDMMQLIHPSNH